MSLGRENNMKNSETRSIASLKREEKRSSLEVVEFKKQVECFLSDKPEYISYSIKRDLACMTNMPFYKDRPKRVKIGLSNVELLEEWIKIFSEHNDFDFITRLLKQLNRNQAQLLRKVSPRKGIKKDIWEHAIPTSFFVNEIVLMIKDKDLRDLKKLILLYVEAGQHSLSTEENELLKQYNSSMPSHWNWRDFSANPLERYSTVGININTDNGR